MLEGIVLCYSFNLDSYLVGVVDQVRPDEGVAFLGFHFKAFFIFSDFYSVVRLVLDVERVLDFSFVDEKKVELICVVALIDIDPYILNFSGGMGLFEFESHRSAGGGIASEIAADKSLFFVSYGNEVDLG